jgi:Predicted periplasmic protein
MYMKKTYLLYGIIVLVLIIAAGAYAFMHIRALNGQLASTTPMTLNTTVQYSCVEGAFTALFTDGQATLTFPGGRTLILPQAVSGSGVRYEANGVAFIGKGSDAFLTENDKTTYTDCVASASNSGGMSGDTGAGLKTFADASKTFQFMYPSMFTVTGGGVGYTLDWMNGSSQNGLVLARVTIPKSYQPNTNFSDARFTVGTSADPDAVKTCLTEGNGNPVQATKVTIKGIEYSKMAFNDAGAGNRYETTSYRALKNGQCYVVEYTIHSTNIGNYPTDSGITEFDNAAVQRVLDGMVQSFTFL